MVAASASVFDGMLFSALLVADPKDQTIKHLVYRWESVAYLVILYFFAP